MHSLIDLIFPPTCMLCGGPGADGRDICAGCAADLPHNSRCCALCALPLEGAPVGAVCGQCTRRPPPYDRCIAALRYEGAARHLVGMVKFHHRLSAARLLGEVLADAVSARTDPLPEVLLPVPLHPARLARRGYNQALEIGRGASRRLRIPMAVSHCERTRATPPQSGLDERARRQNVRGAFRVRAPLPWRRIAVLDDVVTTGSTVAELSRVLHRAGAEYVEVWAAARTP